MQEIDTWPGWNNVRFLGEGSFGKVYEIEHTDYGQTYRAALKVISVPAREVDEESIFLTRQFGFDTESYYESTIGDFMKEVAVLSQLVGNTNIVSYQDHMVLHEPGTMHWDILLRMELLTSLSEYIDKNGFDEMELVKMGIDVCRALELCEQHGIIHRDIKLSNIFVSDAGAFKLGDFGVAKTVQNTEVLMSRKGALAYMAPEVYHGRRYGHQADIYSLGMVMYTILNDWRPPFLQEGEYQDGDRVSATMKRLNAKVLPPPSGGTHELQSIILKALAYDPQDRYLHASHMRADLERYLAQIQQKSNGKVPSDENRQNGLVRFFSGLTQKYRGLWWHFCVSNLFLLIAAGICIFNAISYISGVWVRRSLSVDHIYTAFPALKYWITGIGIAYFLCFLFAIMIWRECRRKKRSAVWKLEVYFPLLFVLDCIMFTGVGFITGVPVINKYRLIIAGILVGCFCLINVVYYKKNGQKLKGAA